MRKKWHKTKVIYICLLVILAIWCCRIVYVNFFYKKPVSVTNTIGESFSYQNFSIVVNAIQKYNKEDWIQYYKDNYGIELTDTDDEGFVVVIDYTVKNVSDEHAKFAYSNTYAQVGTLFNGFSVEETNTASGSKDKMSSKDYAPGDTQNIKQIYHIYKGRTSEEKFNKAEDGKISVKICEYSCIHTIWSE